MHHVEEQQRRVKNAAPKVYKIVLLCSFKHRNFHFLISLICAGVLLLQCSPVCLPCQIIMFTINNYLFRLLPTNRRECWLHYCIGVQRGRRRRGDAREMRFEDIDEKRNTLFNCGRRSLLSREGLGPREGRGPKYPEGHFFTRGERLSGLARSELLGKVFFW